MLEIVYSAAAVVAENEVLQLVTSNDTETSEQAYLEVIRCKTAALFAAACRIGAVVADRPKVEEEALDSFGLNLGIAFQLIDDVLDYSGDHVQTGKNLGDDLAEGKATLPLIYAMRQGTAAQRDVIRAAIEHGGLEEFRPVLAAIEETGALAYSRGAADTEAQRAIASLEPLPNSPYKDSLLQLAAFAVSRSY